MRSSSSSEVASAQCRSSLTISTGCCRANGLKLVEKRGECLPPLLHRTEDERRIALAGRDRKQRGNQRRRGRDLLRPARQHGLELVELLFGRSCGLMPAERSSWATKGCSALLVW